MVLRINGSSGLDIDTIVSKLMAARRIPVDKLIQSRQTLQWQRESYREMNSKILEFRNDKLFNYRMEGAYSIKKVDISGNAAAVTAKANPDASTGTLTIATGATLAASATNIGSDIRKAGATPVFDPSLKIADQQASLDGILTGSTYTLTINSKSITVDPATQSLNDVISQINQKTDVNAFYDTTQGKISFTTKATGASAAIDFGTDTSFAANILKVNTAATTAGTDAIVTINGILTSRATNTFNVNGVAITLNQTNSSATLSVSSDTDKILESVKNFIKDYNDVVKTINDKISEPRYRDYVPLTDEQKKNMKDTEIQLWETKAKSGLLKNDSILSKAAYDLRMDAGVPVNTGDPVYTTLSSIGVETGAYNEHGKLYLKDENKLRAAIEANPNAVKNLFAAKDDGSGNQSNIGIAERMYQSLKVTLDQFTQKAGYASLDDSSARSNSSIGKQLFRLNTNIDTGNTRLKVIEDRYYKQFTAMETAMNRYNQQSAYLTNALAGGQK